MVRPPKRVKKTPPDRQIIYYTKQLKANPRYTNVKGGVDSTFKRSDSRPHRYAEGLKVEKWMDAAIESIVESAPQMLGGSIHYSNLN
jgi:hypothetical protein